MRTIFIWMITFLLITHFTITDAKTDIPITYLSYVDNLLGFYKVTDLTTHEPSPYENRTLIINKGDTVTWINDADNVILTISSEDKLFNDKRLNIRQRSSYTFDQIGTYIIYIKEFPYRKQTIIVNELGSVGIDNTPISTSPESTIIISTPVPMIPINIQTSNSTNPEFPSTIQIASTVVAILSIFITYWKK